LSVYNQIKSVLPAGSKYPFWYIFKAPQRRLHRLSLLNDLSGITLYLFYRVFPKKRLKPISICTGLLNRSDNYLQQLLPAINKAGNQDLIELSVFDCNSTDIPALEQEIRKQWKGKLVFRSEPVAFSRSYTFNRAVEQATSPVVFICDADMSVPENIVRLCNQYTGHKRVWYPIVYFLFRDKPAVIAPGNGVWEQYSGKGMVACLKEDFTAIGKLNERFTSWGAEDNELWERFYKAGYTVITNRQPGMLHHWHTTHNKKYAHMN
jgi:glycosyltransferase involved in cell wall biosynthesis